MMTALPMTIGRVGASRQTSKAHQRRPQDRGILQRGEHGGAGERQRAGDQDEGDHRHDADQRHQAEVEGAGRRPGERNGGGADQAAAGELPQGQLQPVGAAKFSGQGLAEREHARAEQSERRGPGERCGEGRSAITTPTKPIATAIQRNRSTFSPSSGADSAVTISGEAM